MSSTAPPNVLSDVAPPANARFLGDPHGISDHDFPRDGSPEDQLRFLLHYAALAPSVLNTQPWRFAIERSIVRLYADRSRQLRALDPSGRELTVSCGTALLNLRIAAYHFRLDTEVYPFPVSGKPDLLAALLLSGTARPTNEDELLFRAITRRRTNRHPFAKGAVPNEMVAALQRGAREEGARLAVLEHTEEKNEVARLVEEGVRLQGQDPAIVAELDAWLRPKSDPRRDGVADAVQGPWDRLANVHTPSSTVAVNKRDLVARSPAVLVLSTDADAPRDWLAAGQALGRVLLTATAQGVQASYVNQPVEVVALRKALSELAGGGFPQVVFRIGFPARYDGTPRRHMQDVLFQDAPDEATAQRDA